MKRILFSVLLAVFFVSVSAATTVLKMDFDRQAVKADLIVVGEAVSSEPIQWRGYPCSKVSIKINQIVAGQTQGDIVYLIEPGYGKFEVIGAKHLQKGSGYLLFLEKTPEGYYLLLGFNQGAHNVAIEKNAARKVVVSDGSDKLESGMTLDAAIKRIHAVRASAGLEK